MTDEKKRVVIVSGGGMFGHYELLTKEALIKEAGKIKEAPPQLNIEGYRNREERRKAKHQRKRNEGKDKERTLKKG